MDKVKGLQVLLESVKAVGGLGTVWVSVCVLRQICNKLIAHNTNMSASQRDTMLLALLTKTINKSNLDREMETTLS